MISLRLRSAEVEDEVCRRDDCPEIELHAAHAGPIPRRTRGRREIIKVEATPTGPLAYVACPRCGGSRCAECLGLGYVSLIRWHAMRERK